jgi:hypothetical protein
MPCASTIRSTEQLCTLQVLCTAAKEAGKTNVAFLANFLLHNLDACIDLLVASGRVPEATFFARAYRPSRVPALVAHWQAELRQVNAKAADSLASPDEYANLFPDWHVALQIEEAQAKAKDRIVPAALYATVEGEPARDLLSLVSSPTLCQQVRCPGARCAVEALRWRRCGQAPVGMLTSEEVLIQKWVTIPIGLCQKLLGNENLT